MPEMTPEPDSNGGENKKKKKNQSKQIMGCISCVHSSFSPYS
jgi:hypothetical protein